MSHSELPAVASADHLGSPKRPSTGGFQSTDWSVLASLNSPEFSEALSQLCQQYWYPVYAFIRRQTPDTHRAEDLTQGFFCKVVALQTFRMADRERGRFRAFLLTSVKNYLASEYQASRAKKREGDRTAISLDFAMADHLYQRNRSSEPTPEHAFDRAWAISVIERAIERLREDYSQRGDDLRFDCFLPVLRSSQVDYPAVARRLGLSEVATRKAVSRFRIHYGHQLRAVIAGTLSDDESVEEEIDWILRVLAI